MEDQKAANQQFMDETIEKYAIKKENDDSKSLLSKDKAYLAAGKIVEKFKQL